jgi:hypothetical protein
MSWSIRNAFIYLLDLLMAGITFFLGLRFVFNLIAANPSTPFVAWIYQLSNSLIYPFSGIVPNFTFGSGVFDMVALISLLAYAIVFYLLGALLDALLPVRSVHYVDRRERVVE